MKILVVDDEPNVLSSFNKMLTGQGYETIIGPDAEAAIPLLESHDPDLLIMDIHLPGMNGLEAFRLIKKKHPRLPVIIMTAYGTTETAIEATKLGAFDYMLKPFEPKEMLKLIENASESVRLMRRQVRLDPEHLSSSADAIIGQSAGMQEVYKAIGRVAQTGATVLIRGETGTGKELVARAIYQHSLRAEAPLLKVNCVAIPETLLESELFGHEKGAFTGASTRRIGKFEKADGGTVFLDEIGDVPLSVQSKILRILQERCFERVGSNDTIQVDVRIIAATNRNLEESIAAGAFREDLYHRLNVVTIKVPPLRDRREDIPKLADYFLNRFSVQLKIDAPTVSPEAMNVIKDHWWPGNVRELEHCVHRALIFTKGYPIQETDVRRALEQGQETVTPEDGSRMKQKTGAVPSFEGRLQDLIEDYFKGNSGTSLHVYFMDMVDKLLVTEALRRSRGNQTHAARLLGLSRPTLQTKMQKYRIRREMQYGEE